MSLVKDQGFSDIAICYSSPRGDDLDTRLLRAMVRAALVHCVLYCIVVLPA